jgi:ASC-1-like (ASCH) protein
MLHALKTIQPYFNMVKEGKKRFELRKEDDRNYNEGDTVVLQEWDGEKYTGQEITFTIGVVLRNVKQFGLKDGFCAFSLLEQ